MVDCVFCYAPVGGGNKNSVEHDECAAEYNTRCGDRMCVRCGKNPWSVSMLCSECSGTAGRFRNYPGGN